MPYLGVQKGRAAPVGPACLVSFIIVSRCIDVCCGMYEAEDDAVRSPVDDDFACHVMFVYRYLVYLWEEDRGATKAETLSNAGETGVSDAEGRSG